MSENVFKKVLKGNKFNLLAPLDLFEVGMITTFDTFTFQGWLKHYKLLQIDFFFYLVSLLSVLSAGHLEMY